MSAAVAVVTSCCHPVWWATPQFWGPWLPWCTMVMAFSTASETTGGQKRRVFIRLFLVIIMFFNSVFTFTGKLVLYFILFLPPGLLFPSQRGSLAVRQMLRHCTTSSVAPCTRCSTWPPPLSYKCSHEQTGSLKTG